MKKCIELNNTHYDAYFNLNLIQVGEKQYDSAVSNLLKSLFPDPENKETIQSIKKCYEDSDYLKKNIRTKKYNANDFST